MRLFDQGFSLFILLYYCFPIVYAVFESQDDQQVAIDDASDDIEFVLYSTIQQTLKYPAYEKHQRLLIAQQAKEVLSVYVNKDLRRHQYHVDPDQEIQDIIAHAHLMTDQDFHSRLSNLFLSLRDFHTSYTLPKPVACFSLRFPIIFDFFEHPTASFTRPFIVAVKRLASDRILKLAPDIEQQVQPGDILVLINGKSFHEWHQTYKNITGGSNIHASYRSALDYMTFRDLSTFPPTHDTQVVYTLQRHSSRQIYTVKAPLVAAFQPSCLDHQSSVWMDVDVPLFVRQDSASSAGKSCDIEMKDASSTTLYNPSSLDRKRSVDHVQGPLNPWKSRQHVRVTRPKHSTKLPRSKKLPPFQEYPIHDTKETAVKWSIYRKKGLLLGIIRLESFESSLDPDGKGFIQTVRSLLLNELKETDALLFDVRDNYGGIIWIAEMLPQFFVTHYDTEKFRALISPLNEQLFTLGSYSMTVWPYVYKSSASQNTTHTQGHYLHQPDKNLYFGQVYFKPVGVYTNANCYSSCEIFTSLLQDSGSVIVFGEDLQTGGGGANVVSYKDFFLKELPYEFPLLPGDQDFTVAWLQALRTNRKMNQVLEEEMVQVNHVIRPRLSDVIHSGKQYSFFDRILDHLLVPSTNPSLHFQCIPHLKSDISAGLEARFHIEAQGFSDLVVIRDDQTILGHYHVTSQTSKQSISIPDDQGVYRVHRLTWIGFQDGERKFSTFRYLRYIPPLNKYLELLPGTVEKWDYNIGTYAAIYNRDISMANIVSPPQFGWQVLKDKALLQVNSYHGDVYSALSFFVSLKSSPRSWLPLVKIEAVYDLDEVDTLSLTVYIGSQSYVLHSVSGKGRINESFALDAFQGQERIEVCLFYSSPEHLCSKKRFIQLKSVVFQSIHDDE